jgi:hypothetical protein
MFRVRSLKTAIERMGFVQADPIRSPARAQDLILRHRVNGYHAGDLERRYGVLDVEEGLLYAYGFLPRATWRLLHPCNASAMSELERKVLAIVRDCGELHPRDLEAHLGRERAVNLWGGYSKATTQALEALHYRGLLRISRRENGIRMFEVAPPASDQLPAAERLRRLTMLLASIFAPAPEKTLRSVLSRLRYSAPDLGKRDPVLKDLLHTGELERDTVDGIDYLWPSGSAGKRGDLREVRLLAPFDPVVWDRLRFEHLWGWPYRFEAYTPAAKRQLGYYALPLVWRNRVIGWGNASVKEGRLDVQLGYIGKRPAEGEFGRALDEEIARMAEFLGVRN